MKRTVELTEEEARQITLYLRLTDEYREAHMKRLESLQVDSDPKYDEIVDDFRRLYDQVVQIREKICSDLYSV